MAIDAPSPREAPVTRATLPPSSLLIIDRTCLTRGACPRRTPLTSVRRKSRPWDLVGQSGVVEAEQVEDRRLDVVDVDRVFGDVEAEVVGRPQA